MTEGAFWGNAVILVFALLFIGARLDRLAIKCKASTVHLHKALYEESAILWDDLIKSIESNTFVDNEIKLSRERSGQQTLTMRIHKLLCALFDYVYGAKLFSFRRVFASMCSTAIALIVFAAILDRNWSQFIGGYSVGILIFVVPLLNLIPDFFSLAETRLVLEWSKKSNALLITILFGFDVVASIALFVAGVSLTMIIFDIYTYGINELPYSFWEFWSLAANKAFSSPLRVFLLTTFVTSLIWFLFLSTYVFVRLFGELFPFMLRIFVEVGRSGKPATTLSAIFGCIVIFLSLILKITGSLLSQ